jgi:hypothetical protein
VPPITRSLVEVLFRTTSVARSYAQFRSVPGMTGQSVLFSRHTCWPPTRRLVRLRLVPVAPTKVSEPVRFSDEPVELSKLNELTALDPAENAPVSARFEPVALVQIMRFTVVSCDTFKLVPVPAPKVNGPVRFNAEPVALPKLKVVTVDDPAEKAPVNARLEPVAELYVTRLSVASDAMFTLEPVAFVKFTTVMDPVAAVRPAVRDRFEPVAPLKDTVFSTEPPLTARDAPERVPAANTEPFVYTEDADPIDPSTYKSLPLNWKALFEMEDVAAPITRSLF